MVSKQFTKHIQQHTMEWIHYIHFNAGSRVPCNKPRPIFMRQCSLFTEKAFPFLPYTSLDLCALLCFTISGGNLDIWLFLFNLLAIGTGSVIHTFHLQFSFLWTDALVLCVPGGYFVFVFFLLFCLALVWLRCPNKYSVCAKYAVNRSEMAKRLIKVDFDHFGSHTYTHMVYCDMSFFIDGIEIDLFIKYIFLCWWSHKYIIIISHSTKCR